MSLPYPVYLDASVEPGRFAARLQDSLRSKSLNPQFHYLSRRQARAWLELHKAYAPSRVLPGAENMYRAAFAASAEGLEGRDVMVVGLGCGGGRKDLWLIQALLAKRCRVRYVSADISAALVQAARACVLGEYPELVWRGLVLDVMEAEGLEKFWAAGAPAGEVRLFSFLGMLPNLPWPEALERVSGGLRSGDRLLLSANLAPGEDYSAGCEQILPQYDNQPTRHWLSILLQDLELPVKSVDLAFSVEERNGVKRVSVSYIFKSLCQAKTEEGEVDFEAGEKLEVFFSNRLTPELLEQGLRKTGLKPGGSWVMEDGEEGVWLTEKE